MTSSPDWQTLRFDQIAHNIAERIDPAEADTGIYVGLEHLDPESLHIKRWGTPADVKGTKLCFYKGDIIFGRRRAYQRKLAIAEFDGICSAHAMVLRANEQNVLPEFLPFFMQSDTFFERALKISVGSLSPTINWKTLARQEFTLPPLDEQHRIAEILWAADDAVEKWQKTLEQIEVTRHAYRHELFGNSKDIKRVMTRKLFDVQLGKMLSSKARKGISPRPYLANANVQWGYFDLNEVREMDFDKKEFEKFSLRPGDLLVCEGGEVGRAAIWQGQIEGCCYQKALHRLRPLDDTIRVEIMQQYLAYAAETGILARLTGHSTIAHLTAIKLKTLKVPVYPKNAQDKIVRVLQHLKLTKKETECHLDRTQHLFKITLDELLQIHV